MEYAAERDEADWNLPHRLVESGAIREVTGDGGAVELVETHISWVLLTEREVFKLKKPVVFPFLDFGTRERRRAACEAEVALNRRLAAEVYLGVLPITTDGSGRLKIGGEGEDPSAVVDHCVHMKRLPGDAFLDARIRAGRVSPRELEGLMVKLVEFYANAAVPAAPRDFAGTAAIEKNVRDNLAVLSAAKPALAGVQRIAASQLLFLRLHEDFFARRIDEGRVRDGHGDLRPEHVCLLERPVVIDCIEFNPAFRIGDVLGEIAFLAMECEMLGEGKMGIGLLETYRRLSGDQFPWPLARFEMAYRACVRAKVELLRAEQLPAKAAHAACQRASRYVQLASFFANDFYRPRLLVMVGATGSGKSTLARVVAEALGMVRVSTDEARREPAGGPGPDAPYGAGPYSKERTDSVYERVFERARILLEDSASIVLDGTFREAAKRAAARRLGEESGAEVLFVLCECRPEVAEARIAARRATEQDASEARPEFHRAQARELSVGLIEGEAAILSVDTELPLPRQLDHVIGRLRQVRRMED